MPLNAAWVGMGFAWVRMGLNGFEMKKFMDSTYIINPIIQSIETLVGDDRKMFQYR